MIHITFTKNLYDQDGDIYNHGIFLFINDDVIVRVDNIEDIGAMIKNLQNIEKELIESN